MFSRNERFIKFNYSRGIVKGYESLLQNYDFLLVALQLKWF